MTEQTELELTEVCLDALDEALSLLPEGDQEPVVDESTYETWAVLDVERRILDERIRDFYAAESLRLRRREPGYIPSAYREFNPDDGFSRRS